MSRATGLRNSKCSLVVAVLIAFSGMALTAFSPAAQAQDQDVVPQPRTGEPINGLTEDELDRFDAGRTAFRMIFVAEDGLGPVFNKDSCGGCHNQGGDGGAGSISVTRFGFLSKSGFDPLDDQGGSLRQMEAIDDDCAEFVPDEANVEIKRQTNSTFGIGLVEAISDDDIEDLEDPDADGISGRVHWVLHIEDPDGPLHAGRFGWKAQLASVLSFSADASLNEIGLTNRLVGTENAPNGDPDLLAECDDVDDPEDDPDDDETDFIDLVTDFQRFLAPPPQTPRDGMAGEQVFIDTGCADCHIAEPYVTQDVDSDALSEISIKPYSDFLLHDMGNLADRIEQGDATIREMRTPSLWGLRHRNPMLHDGRADDFEFADRVNSAILEHDGEGEASVDAYSDLSEEDTDDLVAFLASLGRPEFDHDGNIAVNESDFEAFLACFLAGLEYGPDDDCAISDIDQDGDVDADDFEHFLTVYSGDHPDCNGNDISDLEDLILGGAGDCNGNGVPDACDIEEGLLPDLNSNGVADLCETFVRGDSNSSGGVDLADAINALDVLFNATGSRPCDDAADSNDDGRLDIADPISLLAFLFQGGTVPASPYPDCGLDSSVGDDLTCEAFTACD